MEKFCLGGNNFSRENPNSESACAAGGCPEDHGTSACRRGGRFQNYSWVY